MFKIVKQSSNIINRILLTRSVDQVRLLRTGDIGEIVLGSTKLKRAIVFNAAAGLDRDLSFRFCVIEVGYGLGYCEETMDIVIE